MGAVPSKVRGLLLLVTTVLILGFHFIEQDFSDLTGGQFVVSYNTTTESDGHFEPRVKKGKPQIGPSKVQPRANLSVAEKLDRGGILDLANSSTSEQKHVSQQLNESAKHKGIRVVMLENSTSTLCDEPLIDGVTILIPTYKREGLLMSNPTLIEQAQLQIVDRIILSWNDVTQLPSRQLLKHFSKPEFLGKIYIQIPQENSLLNRFRVDHVRTKAVFSIDDDRCYPGSELNRLFYWWKVYPNHLVGSFRRKAYCENNECFYKPGAFSKFNLLLPGGGLMSSRMNLERLWNPEFEVLRKHVNEQMNCEDLLLNLILPDEYERKIHVPVAECIVGQIPGLADKRGHLTKRNNCVKVFTEFGLKLGQLHSSHNDRTGFPV